MLCCGIPEARADVVVLFALFHDNCRRGKQRCSGGLPLGWRAGVGIFQVCGRTGPRLTFCRVFLAEGWLRLSEKPHGFLRNAKWLVACIPGNSAENSDRQCGRKFRPPRTLREACMREGFAEQASQD